MWPVSIITSFTLVTEPPITFICYYLLYYTYVILCSQRHGRGEGRDDGADIQMDAK